MYLALAHITSSHKTHQRRIKPFNASCFKLLLFKGFSASWSNPPFLIFDIRALWHSGVSARVPECQKLKMVGYTWMVKCKVLMGSAVKG